ncbi:Sugar or nucleoside kinase, ribokinase family [Sinosporangium album]|uniref:Sugar or nucleoside kinase, ribokinase family n=1 Tax=Sinosporangium album TaxID=504805 RepID=A0A1G8GTP9_9ACTN|nr:carbohydrate kinase family protein [Sinosporangium album]SDH97739.1 Sugar or nucleoside kinase, ribokinase family [Sinosporangium album]
MTGLGVIGNISIDTAHYPDGRSHVLLGGAALYVSLAAAQAGALVRPVAAVGDELAHLPAASWPETLDLTHVARVAGPSCRFEITYGADGQVVGITTAYGVAAGVTAHALAALGQSDCDRWHVCCRRPLDVGQVLGRLMSEGRPFSLDFHLASASEQISAAKAALPYAEVVFVNAAEYRLLSELVAVSELATVVVSDGPRKVALLRHGRCTSTHMPSPGPVVEVTGAGDTLAGTFLAETLHGASESNALAAAVTAATQQARHPALPYDPP